MTAETAPSITRPEFVHAAEGCPGPVVLLSVGQVHAHECRACGVFVPVDDLAALPTAPAPRTEAVHPPRTHADAPPRFYVTCAGCGGLLPHRNGRPAEVRCAPCAERHEHDRAKAAERARQRRADRNRSHAAATTAPPQ